MSPAGLFDAFEAHSIAASAAARSSAAPGMTTRDERAVVYFTLARNHVSCATASAQSIAPNACTPANPTFCDTVPIMGILRRPASVNSAIACATSRSPYSQTPDHALLIRQILNRRNLRGDPTSGQTSTQLTLLLTQHAYASCEYAAALHVPAIKRRKRDYSTKSGGTLQ